MATKTNVTNKSTPKTAKSSSPVSTQDKKKSAESLKPLAPQSVPSAEPVKSAKISSKKASQPLSDPTESMQTTVPKPAEELIVSAAVEQATPQSLPVEALDKRWQEIKLILEKLKEDTLREIRKSVKNGTEAVAAIEPGGDIYDQASSERDRELGLLLGDREREKIHSIDEALLRIDEGDYGICEECDEDIPLGRLKAMPFTRHCVKCKSDLEKLQAQTKRVEEERAYREIPLGAEEEE